MLFMLVFGIWSNWPAGEPRSWGGSLLLFLLLLILGYAQFGSPIR